MNFNYQYFNRLRSLLFCFFLIACNAFYSCSSGTSKKEIEASKKSVTTKEVFALGKVSDAIVCNADASLSYALYLPSGYSAAKKYPVVYAFDPHGTGKYPLSLYKALAEKYGFIMIGSNNSKNGLSWEESQRIANTMFADVLSRFSIDTKRVYTLGFSGGARIANALAITNGAIAGVICCGAAIPATTSESPRSDYSFIGIGGNEDFNYTEMQKYLMVDLAGHNVKNALLTFNGKHEWPSEEYMNQAFWWLELNEMRKKSIPVNAPLLAKNIQPLVAQLKILEQKKQVFEIYNLCKQTIGFYDGLTDLSEFYSAYKATHGNQELDKKLKLQEHNWGEEDKLKQFFVKAFQTQSLDWWTKELKELAQKIKTDKNADNVLIYKRTFSFLSLAAFMQTNGALNQNAIPAANQFCKIYLMVDPQNADAHYLAACISAKQNNADQAIQSLETAIKYGFSDAERLKNDSFFEALKNNTAFQKIVQSIKPATL